MLNNCAFSLKYLSEIVGQDAGIRIIAFKTIALVPALLTELSHLAVLAEERPRGEALEKLTFFNSFGNAFRDDCSICYCLGEALVADVRNGSFLMEMGIGLFKDLLSVQLSLDFQ